MWKRLKLWWAGVDLNRLVASIQAMTVSSCNFLPMATSVAAVVLAGNPAVVTAASVSSAICAAIKRSQSVGGLLGDSPMPIEVDGIVIKGEFVGK